MIDGAVMIKLKEILKENSNEDRRKKILDKINSIKIGETVSEDVVYQYIQQIHRNYDDFIEGDISNRIENYSSYTLKNIPISNIDIDEFEVQDDLVNDYINHYIDTKKMIPIVVGSDFEIIDGIHRANAAYKLNLKNIDAFVGND